MTTTLPGSATTVTVADQAPRLLAQVAGYIGHRTITMGLRNGLIGALADASSRTPAQLATQLDLDPFFVAVWCRAALAAGVCEPAAGGETPAGDDASDSAPSAMGAAYRLAPHMATLLLDTTHPGYAGGVFLALEQPEVFDRFESSLPTGERMWWDGCSADWITSVAATGSPFYTRLIPSGLDRIPGVGDRVRRGCRILDSACGSGAGLIRLAQHYPACHIVGVDGDAHSLTVAREHLAAAGLADRVTLVRSTLEDLRLDEPVAVVINNISMHECRDIDAATARIRAVLEPGGHLVISDFPFPDSVQALQSVPGRVMSGIQFFEAQIDDQLLPRSAYLDLLGRHGFADIGQFDISAVHTVTHGRS